MWEGFPRSELYIAKSLVKSGFGRLTGILKATSARFGGGAQRDELFSERAHAKAALEDLMFSLLTTPTQLSTQPRGGRVGISILNECSKENSSRCAKAATKRRQPKKRKLGLKQGKPKRRRNDRIGRP